MFYDVKQKVFVSAQDLQLRGIPTDDAELLAKYGFFQAEFDRPEYNPDTEGIEPDGPPEPSEEVPNLYIQKYKIIPLLANFKQEKKAFLASERWNRQTKGITVAGVSILTAPEDESRMAATVQAMEAGNIPTTEFKTANGWYRVTLAALKDMLGTVGKYVRDCYANERRLSEQIDAAEKISDLNDIDVFSGWPDNTDHVEEQEHGNAD